MARVKQRTLYPTTQFRRDVKKQWAELITPDWVTVIYCLMNGHDIPKKYRDHALSGEWSGFRECHIKPDLLLIYETDEHTVQLVRLGSHSELFG
ncbi:type II toxin-antitoxin system YafQ family toxin [Cardiobacterium hominis]|jgi:addiction module toxin, relE/stbE family|uniref:type II toxin-antitoxin system YafQ family toxin n=1 Tax=Cardiobacterium hominis TaxID=2718 RepID=UPI00360FF073